MKKLWFLVGALSLAWAVFAGTASAAVTVVTIGASPNPVLNGQQTTISGTVTVGGVPQPSTAVTLNLYNVSNCTSLITAVALTTDGSGNYTGFTTVTAVSPPVTIYFQASSLSGLSSCLPVTWVASLPAAPQPQEDNTFLCYSKFEQDSGMVVPADLVDQFLKGGYWKPFAVKGTPPSPSYATAGAYYLSCNPPASMKPTGFGVDLGGLDTYPLPQYDSAATVFPIVG